MALLTNFSFPISRFIIDAANIPMYYIANVVFGANSGSLGAVIGEESRIGTLLKPAYGAPVQSAPFSTYFAAIIFGWIFLITVFALAIMFLIRLVVLITLVIFSPLGFVAAILPSTKNFADDYWQALFKNAFFGPIMLLVLAIAIYILQAFQQDALVRIARNNVSDPESANTLALWAFYFVPVVIIWGGLIWSQKLGALGASIVMNKANDIAKKSWGGMKPMLWVGDRLGENTPGLNKAYNPLRALPGALKKKYWTDPASERTKLREEERDVMSARLTRGDSARGARKRIENKRVKEQIDEFKKFGTNQSMLESYITEANAKKDPVKAKSAALLLAENKSIKNADILHTALKAMNGDSDGMKKILESAEPKAIKSMDATKMEAVRKTLTDRATLKKLNPTFSEADLNNEIEKIKDSFEGKLKAEGRIDLMIEAKVNANIEAGTIAPADRNSALNKEYKETLAKLDNQTIAKQDKEFFKNTEVQQYLKNDMADKKFQDLYNKMTAEQIGIINRNPTP